MTDDSEPSLPTYAYKTSAFGSGWTFRLEPDALAWERWSRAGRIPYSDVRRIRMTFRPGTLQGRRFVTEVWGTEPPKLTLASTSWKSIVEHERRDESYAAFLTDLHRRVAAAGAAAIFESGVHPLVYWLGVAVYLIAGAGFAAFLVKALQSGSWMLAAIIGVFFALYLWNGDYFRRNRPGYYTPAQLPPLLLPPRQSQ
jgi:hypothetical protein